MYVDILLTGSDSTALAEAKKNLKRHFVCKDMEKPKFFLGIEVTFKNMGYFCLRGNMQGDWPFWGANLLTLQ